jgi:hypothetical protein
MLAVAWGMARLSKMAEALEGPSPDHANR